MLVLYREGGLWPLLWRAVWFCSIRKPPRPFPPPGFVIRGSGSSLVSEVPVGKTLSTQLSRIRFTRNAPPWRLICAWETSPRPLPHRNFGRWSATSGKASAAGGAVTFGRRT